MYIYIIYIRILLYVHILGGRCAPVDDPHTRHILMSDGIVNELNKGVEHEQVKIARVIVLMYTVQL